MNILPLQPFISVQFSDVRYTCTVVLPHHHLQTFPSSQLKSVPIKHSLPPRDHPTSCFRGPDSSGASAQWVTQQLCFVMGLFHSVRAQFPRVVAGGRVPFLLEADIHVEGPHCLCGVWWWAPGLLHTFQLSERGCAWVCSGARSQLSTEVGLLVIQ